MTEFNLASPRLEILREVYSTMNKRLEHDRQLSTGVVFGTVAIFILGVGSIERWAQAVHVTKTGSVIQQLKPFTELIGVVILVTAVFVIALRDDVSGKPQLQGGQFNHPKDRSTVQASRNRRICCRRQAASGRRNGRQINSAERQLSDHLSLTRARLGAPGDRFRWGEAKGGTEGSGQVRRIGEACVHGGCPHQFTGGDLAGGMLER